MKSLKITDAVSSGFNPIFAQVRALDLISPPIGEGAFGVTYRAEVANNACIAVPQVVKLFTEDGSGNAARGLATIRKLQARLQQKNDELARSGLPSLDQLPGLEALPQLSFHGELEGVAVSGYCATCLASAGYVSLEDVFEDPNLRADYLRIDFTERLEFATELVEGFRQLWEMSFIHADINPQNLFIHLAKRKVAIIDFDSGAVTAYPGDKPTTFGKRNDWLAPEIVAQMTAQGGANLTVKVDRFTDLWAVAIGIHQLLFLFHPLFYLRNLGGSTVCGYLGSFQWPEIDKSDSRYNRFNDAVYDAYLQDLPLIPSPVRNRLAGTINRGYSRPALRTTYDQWSTALHACRQPPTVEYFRLDRTSIIQGMPIRLEWSVRDAHHVYLDNGIGLVAAEGSLDLFPAADRAYTLTAHGRFGTVVSAPLAVRVWATPVIRCICVPTPRIDLPAPQVRLPPEALRLQLVFCPDLAVHIHVPGSIGQCGRWTGGSTQGAFTSLLQLPHYHMWNWTNLYERFRAAIRCHLGDRP